MRRLLVLLILLALAAFLYRDREQLFVRDPLGSVTRNGVKESGAQVYINFSNDALIENDNTPMYFTLLEREQPVVAPGTLRCIHYLVCLANGYPEQNAVALAGAQLGTMSSKQVEFTDSDGRHVVVKLR